MKISKHSIVGQFYVLPFIKITYDVFLNGDYELLIGWLNKGISLSFKPNQNKEYKNQNKGEGTWFFMGGVFAGILIFTILSFIL